MDNVTYLKKPSDHLYQGQYKIPAYMDEAILAYVNKGRIPGDFLQAVIGNDLKEAVGRADLENMKNLPAYVYYFYNETPTPCWGSREKMNKWAEHSGLKGMMR